MLCYMHMCKSISNMNKASIIELLQEHEYVNKQLSSGKFKLKIYKVLNLSQIWMISWFESNLLFKFEQTALCGETGTWDIVL